MLVSIVITNYNYAQYITDCLASCMVQTYKPCEIVVVDDCSLDGSRDVITRFASVVPNIRLVCHLENKGYSAAKNTGIRLAKGDLIRLLDADDMLTPNAVELGVETFKMRPSVDLVHGVCERFYGYKNDVPDLRGINPKTYVHAQGRMYRKGVYERYGLYHEGLRSMADKEFVYRLGVHPDSPLPRLINDKRIKETVAWYRKHDVQMHRVRKKHPGYNNRLKKAFERRIRQLRKEGITEENTPWRI